MKTKLKLTIYNIILFRKRHCNKTSAQTFHKITYNTIILARRAIKELNFLGILKAFLDKEKLSVKKIHNTANQNKIK